MGFFRKMSGQETAGSDASGFQAPAPEATRGIGYDPKLYATVGVLLERPDSEENDLYPLHTPT